jgi:tripartite ATP-independent transporter DctM subunit
VSLLILIASGYPLAFSLGGVGLGVGFLVLGTRILEAFYLRAYGIISGYTLLAVPLFIFMGFMMEKSGIALRIFDTLLRLLGKLRGSLAVVTLLTGTVMAACVGIFSASVVTLGLLGLPPMMKQGYNKGLATGSICAGGCLGILIPPSIMLIIYAPMAGLSAGKLFMAAIVPGLILSGLYIVYVLARCYTNPTIGPGAAERVALPAKVKIRLVASSLIPPVILIFGVLGSIFLGIATPTEAGGVGATISIVMAACYKGLTLEKLADVVLGTFKLCGMIMVILVGATMFTGTFLTVGCGDVVEDLILSSPGGRWGAFSIIMLIVAFLGMFLDWIGILLIMVPVVTPLAAALNFDPLWFAIMICVSLQLSYMSPPFAPAIFFLQGTCPPEYGIETGTIIKGVLPFIGLIILAIVLFVAFPEAILWLPSIMIK